MATKMEMGEQTWFLQLLGMKVRDRTLGSCRFRHQPNTMLKRAGLGAPVHTWSPKGKHT